MRNQITKDPTTDTHRTVPGADRSAPGRPAPSRSAPGSASAGRRALAIAGATAAALLVWVVGGPLLGINLDVLKTPGSTSAVPVSAPDVLVSGVVAGLLGWASLAVLERVSARGRIMWRWVAAGVALLSLAGPLTLAQTTGGAVVLSMLHLTVAGVLVTALPARRSH